MKLSYEVSTNFYKPVCATRQIAHRKGLSGFSMVEVLVSIIVLSVGLLGMVGMQSASLQANREARLQSSAVVLARELADMVRGNRFIGVLPSSDPYLGTFNTVPLAAGTPTYCLSVASTTACSAVTVTAPTVCVTALTSTTAPATPQYLSQCTAVCLAACSTQTCKDACPAASATTTCTTATATAICKKSTAIANAEMTEWLARVDEQLPGAVVKTCFDTTPFDTTTGLGQWACSDTGDTIVIKIGWTRGSTNRALTGASAVELAKVSDASTHPSVVMQVTSGAAE
jgi:type IV pilus assembly protein PilV